MNSFIVDADETGFGVGVGGQKLSWHFPICMGCMDR